MGSEMNTLHQALRHHARNRPDSLAIAIEDRRIGYGELMDRAEHVAGALAGAGLMRGDRICWLSKNHESGFELLIGACLAGIVLVPINWRLAPAEIRFILEDSECRMLFVSTEFMPVVAGLAPDLPQLGAVICTDAPADMPASYLGWRNSAGGCACPPADPEEIAVQLYTSGTTGRPKGAMLSHRALLASKSLWRDLDWYEWRTGDVGLLAMPMFHIGGLGWGLMALEAGMPSLILAEFDAMRILALVDAHAFTKTFLVPAALQALIDHPNAAQTDFSAVRTILYGASPMPLALLERSMELIGCDFAQQYGMTETAGTVAALAPADHRPGNPRLASAGRALPGVEIAIRGPDGTTLPPSAIGQIAIRGCANMSGYWRRPDATTEAVDDDGWLLTGDAGWLDSEGYLHVCDRINDMIISGGENVYPAEVESALSSHPAVAEAAVVGLPDDRWGEAVVGVIVARDGTVAADEEIIAWARERIAAFKAPKRLVRIDQLPRNASGKILRRVLRETLGRR